MAPNIPYAKDFTHAPPLPCPYAVGDAVIFTNDYGVEFPLTVRGFAKEPHGVPNHPEIEPRFVYVFTDAWWFPVRVSELRHPWDPPAAHAVVSVVRPEVLNA